MSLQAPKARRCTPAPHWAELTRHFHFTCLCCHDSPSDDAPYLSHAPVTLHSDGAKHETITLSPPRSTAPLISRNNTRTLPLHRRANTEYIAQPPLFEEGLEHTISDRPRNTPWNDTFPKKKLEARARVLSDWFQGKSDPVDLGLKMGPNGDSDGAGLDSRPASTSMSHTRKNSAPVTSRFSFFGLRRQENKPSFPVPAEDEFLNLDITAALTLPNSILPTTRHWIP